MQTGTVRAFKEAKVLIENDTEMHLARREILLTRSLNHANIIKTFGHEEIAVEQSSTHSAHVAFRILMEPCILSLGDLIAADIAKDHLLRIGKDICAGLTYIHEKAIMHRDLKPGNILVRFTNLEDRLWSMNKSVRHKHLNFKEPFNFCIADFGLSRYTQGVQQSVVGTFRYMATEIRRNHVQAKGDYYNEAVDIYSLGMMLFELISQIRSLKRSGKPGFPKERQNAVNPPVIRSGSAINRPFLSPIPAIVKVAARDALPTLVTPVPTASPDLVSSTPVLTVSRPSMPAPPAPFDFWAAAQPSGHLPTHLRGSHRATTDSAPRIGSGRIDKKSLPKQRIRHKGMVKGFENYLFAPVTPRTAKILAFIKSIPENISAAVEEAIVEGLEY
ncbi:CTD kinase subunit alpha [Elsinoe australis]|uniref:CTD kinase subunit alpha n=1 Tax=Elsinoe australis TaxID=40998 RepID=A0A2P7Z0Z5_9PEZI|nr:CTD kinase subunit alpha [Elsinoe australis]